MAELAVYDKDPTIYLFTSLTAGSSHIVTATSRIETILRANKIPFKGVDTATDELAKKLFQRRASGKKLPLVVKEGYVLGGIDEIEEWNEYDEIREALGVTTAFTAFPAKPSAPTAPAKTTSSTTSAKKENVPTSTPEQNLALRQLGAEAAKAAASKKQPPANIQITNPLLAEKTNTPNSVTLTKSPEKVDPFNILSPRAVPVPLRTPTPASSTAASKDTKGIVSPRAISLPQTPTPAPATAAKDTKKPAASQVKKTDSSTTTKDTKKSATVQTKKPTSSSTTKDTKKSSTAQAKKPKGLFSSALRTTKTTNKSQTKKPASSSATKDAKKPAKAQAKIPKLSDVQKPVHAPPSITADAANPALSAGPRSTTYETSSSSESSSEGEGSAPKTEGVKVDKASEEESSDEEESSEEDEEESSEEESSDEEDVKGKEVEKKQEESSDEEDDEDEDEDEESSEEESDDDDDEDEDTSTNQVPKTQKQDAKDAGKAGASVKD